MYYPVIPQQFYRQDKSRRLTVTGMGEVFVEPDIMTIPIEVQTENESLSQAQQENANRMNQVIQALIQIGIPRESIQTTSFNIFPRYDYIEGEQVFRGYQVTNSIAVKLTNIDQAGDVIDSAVNNGANRVSNIQFSTGDLSRRYQLVLNEAINDAIAKAKTIATNLGVEINPTPITIIEQQSNGQQTPYKTFAASEISTPIEPGQIRIHASVKAVFQY